MPDQNAETYPFARLQFAEGAAPATPGAGVVETYAKADGLIYSKDDAGVETLMSSGVASVAGTPALTLSTSNSTGAASTVLATDATIAAFDATAPTTQALGDAAATGSAGKAARRDHKHAMPAASTIAGYELDYVEFTAPVSITNTTRTTADTVVTGSSVAYNGSTTVMIEFFTIGSLPNTAAASRGLFYVLYEDGTAVGDRLGIHYNPAAATGAVPLHLFRRRTPASGSHTYSIRAYSTAGSASVNAGDGTGTNDMPGFVRITRV